MKVAVSNMFLKMSKISIFSFNYNYIVSFVRDHYGYANGLPTGNFIDDILSNTTNTNIVVMSSEK